MDAGSDLGAQPPLPLRPHFRPVRENQRYDPAAQHLPDDERFIPG